MRIFEYLEPQLKAHANAVNKGADSEQTTHRLFVCNEDDYMNDIQIPRMLQEEQRRAEME